MSEVRNGFAYKTVIGPLPLFIAPVVCMAIALVTAGVQAIKAALLNPATTLRND